MSKCIEIKSCDDCPHIGHRGGFGRISYVPKCNLTNETLPHTVKASERGLVTARYTGEIPTSCPLSDTPNAIKNDGGQK